MVMERAFVLGAAALVASCVFAQDVFAQRSGSRGFGEGGYRAAAPGYVGRPRLRVVAHPGLRWAGQPRLIYYPYSDLPYVPVGTPPGPAPASAWGFSVHPAFSPEQPGCD